MNANLTFHVVVVGGGIAGLVAADSLTGQGISVAVIDKDRAFGNFVVCGEAVQKWVVEELGISGRPNLLSQEIKTISIVNKGKKISFNVVDVGFIIRKGEVIRWMMDRVVRGGGKGFSNTRFVGLDREANGGFRVKALHRGKEVTIKSDFVIAADGMASSVANALGFQKLHGVHGINSLIHSNAVPDGEIRFFVGSEFAGGYGWIFSKGNGYANLGVVGKDPEDVTAKFDTMMQNFHDVSVLSYGRKAIPHGLRGSVALDGVLFIGDAGGFVEPLSYAGIWGAVRSAQMAANSIGKFYYGTLRDRKAVSRDYEKSVNSEFRKRFQLEELAVEVFEKMDNRDWNTFLDIVEDHASGKTEFNFGPFNVARMLLFDSRFRRILKGKVQNGILSIVQKIIFR